jgi:tRNA modification GTPase
VVLNKSDLPCALDHPPQTDRAAVRVSCVNGSGLEELKDAIKEAVWAGEIGPSRLRVVINARHQDALRRARTAALAAAEALSREESLELVALDLRLAAAAVGEIVGKTSAEDLLDSIFSQFCIGK